MVGVFVGDDTDLFDVFRLPLGELEPAEPDELDVEPDEDDVPDVEPELDVVEPDVDEPVPVPVLDFFVPFFHAIILTPRYQK